MKDTPEQTAKIIVQVRAGVLTATEAARQMKISRKTYYEREARALQGMVTALQPGRPGRPPVASEETQRLRAALQQSEQERAVLEQRAQIQQILAGADTRSKKKRGSDRRAANPPTTT